MRKISRIAICLFITLQVFQMDEKAATPSWLANKQGTQRIAKNAGRLVMNEDLIKK